MEKTRYLLQTGHGQVEEFEKKPEVPEGAVLWTRKEISTLEEAVQSVNNTLEAIGTSLAPCSPEIYLSPAWGNFRDRICTLQKYKGNRDSNSRPFYWADLRDYLCSFDDGTTRVVDGEEADDTISIRAREIGTDGFVVVSNDKDLNQIPGLHYNWVTRTSYSVSQHEARRNLWFQALQGDAGDNVGGAWKVGPKRAKEYIDTWFEFDITDKQAFECLVAVYKETQSYKDCPYKDKDPVKVAQENLSLVRLRTEGTEELWTP